MSVIAGLQDFRREAPPADIGVYQFPSGSLVFQFTYSGTMYTCALRGGVRGWILIDLEYSTASHTVILSAANACSSIYVMNGIYVFPAGVAFTNKNNLIIIGENNRDTVFKIGDNATGITPSFFRFSGTTTNIKIKNVGFDGNTANNVGKTPYFLIFSDDASNICIEENRFTDNNGQCLQFAHTTGEIINTLVIKENKFELSSTDCVAITFSATGGETKNLIVINNILSGDALRFLWSHPSHSFRTVSISDNTIEKCKANAVRLNNAIHFSINGNMLTDTPNNYSYVDGIEVLNSVGGTINDNILRWTVAPTAASDGIGLGEVSSYIVVVGNKIIADASYDYLKVGIYVHGTDPANRCSNIIISSNVVKGFRYIGEGVGGDCSRGICVTAATIVDVNHNIIDDYYEAGIRIAGSTYVDVTFNKILNGNVGGYGIWESIPANGYNRIFLNDVRQCTSTILIETNAATTKVKYNAGYVTENSGTATITSGNTSVVTPHGCNYTPAAADIKIILTNNPTNDPGNLYVDTIGAANFTIHCRNDPGATGANFSWSVDKH